MSRWDHGTGARSQCSRRMADVGARGWYVAGLLSVTIVFDGSQQWRSQEVELDEERRAAQLGGLEPLGFGWPVALSSDPDPHIRGREVVNGP